MIINHNIILMNACNNMQAANKARGKCMEKLSSAIRINEASDDAAGLSIYSKMKAQMLGIRQASRNIQDGISLIQVAEGGLKEIEDSYLQRIRELFVYASNDTLTDDDKEKIQQEIDELKAGIDEIANNTEFNGIKLLNGSRIGSSSDTGSTKYDYAEALVLDEVVGSSGLLTLKTDEGYPTTDKDDNQRLVFGTGGTSIPKVSIDGTVKELRSGTITSTVKEESYYKTVYGFLGGTVKVTQYVGIVKDKYELRYSIENNDSVSHNIGFQFNIDTQLGDDDYAPFIINDVILQKEIKYTDIPDKFIVYNQNTGAGANAEFQATGILKSTEDFNIIEEPDKFIVGNYNNVSGWDYTPAATPQDIGDSGYSLLWEARSVGSGKSFVVNTFYGMSVPPTIEDPTKTNNKETGQSLCLHVGSNGGDENLFIINLCDARLKSLGLEDLSINSCSEGLNKIDAAINNISSQRVRIASYQNRLQFSYNNAENYDSSITASGSRIYDCDMAAESLQLSKYSILAEVATAMEYQAKEMPQRVINLLNEKIS